MRVSRFFGLKALDLIQGFRIVLVGILCICEAYAKER